MISNTSRTLELIRRQGWIADKVEQFNRFGGKFGIRHDAFNFIDILALGENAIWAIQSCGQAFSEHHKKLTEDEKAAPNVELWLRSGGKLILIGWRKILRKRGGKMKVWVPRIREYYFKNDEVMWKNLDNSK